MFIVLKQHYEIFWLQILMCFFNMPPTRTIIVSPPPPTIKKTTTNKRTNWFQVKEDGVSVLWELWPLRQDYKLTFTPQEADSCYPCQTLLWSQPQRHSGQTHRVCVSVIADVHSSHWKREIKNDKRFELHFSSWRCRCLHFQCTQVSKRKFLLHI